LTVRDRVIGVRTIESQAVDPFSKEDKRLLSSLAGYTALAMDNARLLEETSHRLAETRMLQEVTLAAASTLDQDRLLERVAAAIQDAVRVEYLGFLFPDETGEQLITHPSLVAPRTVPADRLNAPLERSVTGRAYTTGQSQLIEDVRNFDYYFASIPDVRSELAVPVKVGDRVVAVLNAESERLSAFDEDDLHLFEAIAAQVGIAMENARLYAAEREQRRLLEQSQSQLVQSEKLAATGRLAASLAHEINNPLQAIHNSLQLMLTFSLDPEEQREYMEMADEEVQRLIDMVGRILDFARRPRQELKPTDLNDVIEKVLRLSHKYLQHRRVVLKRDLSDRLPLVLAAPGELSQVFLNLVLNAVDVMPEGGTLRVSSALGDEGDVQIEVADTGPGIAPEYRDLIFEPFFSTKPNGTGLGLSVSHNIVRRHQGEISARNLDGDGALFTVRLPILEAESAKEGEN
jgi:signal transduction histidine kinase